jgi:signal transduction histidine kinase
VTQLRVDLDFEAFSQLISDGIAHVGIEGLVSAWSRGAAAVTGIERSDAIGRSLDELFARVEPPLGFSAVPEPVQFHGAGEARRIAHAMVLSIDDGWLISFGPQQRFSVIDQLKSEIVAAVSHELKTPIATIKAYATTMRMNPDMLAEDGPEFLTTIEEQADRLAAAVDDILRVGRVDARHLLNGRAMVSVDRILDDVDQRLGPSAASRIERRGTATEVACDPALVAEAVARIIDNALKFSPDTSAVVVEAQCDGNGTRISVRDRGIGIGSDHLPYIFDRFYRVERNLTATTAGAGLGLSIAREIVQAHGGSLAVESDPHDGSTFTITLPMRASP